MSPAIGVAPPSGDASRTNIATSVATWSLRERAVWSLPPTGPASSVTRRSIAMWMSTSSSANGKRPVGQLDLDLLERGVQRVAVGLGDDPLRGEHRRRARATARRRTATAAVEAQRACRAPGRRVLRFGEAAHAGR